MTYATTTVSENTTATIRQGFRFRVITISDNGSYGWDGSPGRVAGWEGGAVTPIGPGSAVDGPIVNVEESRLELDMSIFHLPGGGWAMASSLVDELSAEAPTDSSPPGSEIKGCL